MRRAQKNILMLILSIAFCTAFSVLAFCTRTQPHVDEVWSYMLSNKSDSPFLYAFFPGIGEETKNRDEFVLNETESYQKYFHHWHEGDYYRDALTAQPEECYSYDYVFHNQELDTHPPLYYLLLHTICSLFPNQFSWWFAFSINLVFYVGTLLILFFIAKKIGANDICSLLVMLLWGLSAAGVNEVCFLRMYMMLAFLMMCSTYLYLCLLQHFSPTVVLSIATLNVLGFLTQYQSYIYIFFLTLFSIFFLFLKRQYKNGIFLGLSVLASVCTAVAIFPATMKHIFFGYYTPTTFGDNKSFFKALIESLDTMSLYYTGLSTIQIIFLILLVSFLFCVARKTVKLLFSQVAHIFSAPYSLLLFSFLATSGVIYAVSPEMNVHKVRYLFQIMPLFSVLVLFFVEKIFIQRHDLIFALCVMLFVIGSHFQTYPSYFLRSGRTSEFQKYFENTSVIIVDNTHHDQAFAPLLMKTGKTYPTDALDETVTEIISCTENPLYLIVSSSMFRKEEIETFLSDGAENSYTLLGEYYCTTDDPAYHYFYEIKP